VTGSIIADLAENPAATRALAPAGVSVASDQSPRVSPVWVPLVPALWMAGVAVLSLRLLGGWVLTRSLARRAVTVVPPAIDAAAREMARRLELQRAVAILESAAVTVPTLVGWLRPVVLLPAAALSGLSPAQLQAILAHELAHVRRHDYLVNLLQSMVETLLFYHPAVWWVSAQVRAEREHSCDDLAVQVCGDRLVYVSALAELTTIERRQFALAATDGSLLQRVKRILGRQDVRELPPSWGALVLCLVLGGGAGTYDLTTRAAESQQPVPPAVPVAPATPAPPSPPEPSPAPPALPALAPMPSSVPPLPPLAPLAPPPLALAPLAPAPLPPAPWAPAAPALAPAVPPAPPSPALAPVPPLPPAPPEPPEQKSSGNFVWNDNGERLSVNWTGAFRLSEDERDIEWLEEGALLTISTGRVATDRLELRALAGGTIERVFYRRGARRAYDDEARAFLVDAIARMIRSGMFAADRVARFLKRGGPDAVLAEVDRLQTPSSYVKRVYFTALLEQASLSAPQLSRVLERVGQITSDYEKRVVLTQAVAQSSATDDHRLAVARAARQIGSDHEQRVVLIAVMGQGPVSEALAVAVLDAADAVGSSHERSTVLLDLARKGGVTARTSGRFMTAVTAMSSSHDQRRVLTAVSSAGTMPVLAMGDALKAAGVIASSHDKAEVLLELLRRDGLSADTATAFFASARTITSSHDLGRVLRAVAARPNLPEPVVAGLLQAVTGISSSHDRAGVMLEILRTQPLSSAARQQFLTAAEGISSTADQNRVLAALARSERR
jgi:Zn-dependent protease with chaperone function